MGVEQGFRRVPGLAGAMLHRHLKGFVRRHVILHFVRVQLLAQTGEDGRRKGNEGAEASQRECRA
jgi:hypothetical protein